MIRKALKSSFSLKTLVLGVLCLGAAQTSKACLLYNLDNQVGIDQATSLDSVAAASNAFNFKLYQKMAAAKPEENQFMSGFSVFAALAMTAEGANGTTLDILKSTLGLPEREVLHDGLKELGAALGRGDAPYALAVANAIWPEKSFHLQPEFLSIVRSVYRGDAIPLNFKSDYENSRKTINAWVEKQTQQRIKDLLPQGSIDKLTRMVLTNAIYFKGKWKLEFDKKLTKPQPFWLAKGKQVDAPLMYLPYKKAKLRYADMGDYQALSLPYQGDDLSMVVLLPELDGMSEFEQGLDATKWALISSQMNYERVNVWLPKFKIEAGGSIKPALSSMGMAPLFQSADFSKMFSDPVEFVISDVIHKAFVEVNEEGTEAAAATAVIIAEKSAAVQDDPIRNFRADHPFIFAIQHNASKSILFMGKVINPIEGSR
jgi:serpin B